jgi:hypothetical protein
VPATTSPPLAELLGTGLDVVRDIRDDIRGRVTALLRDILD